jgi:exopolysaccharide biosynthesis polyprenyl glycosylphosphotransferase
MLGDACTILFAGAISVLLRTILVHGAEQLVVMDERLWTSPIGLVYLFWFLFAYLLVARQHGLYAPVPSSGPRETRLITQSALSSGLLLCGTFYMTRNVTSSRLAVLLLVSSATLLLCIRRAIWRVSRYRNYARGLELRNVVIVGTNRLSLAVGEHIRKHSRLGCNLSGYLSVSSGKDQAEVPADRILGALEDLNSLVRFHFVDEVVITEPFPTDVTLRLVEEARDLDIDLRAMSGYFPDFTANAPVEYLGVYPLAFLHRRERRVLAMVLKQVMDFVLSSLALLLLLPVLTVISLAILWDSGRPIFYVSERIGKRGRAFGCFKFRTMVQGADARAHELAGLNERDGILFKIKNDPRITPLGRILRKYSLDELPQFFNVLRGEMSIVGPRPPIAGEVKRYELEHLRRLEVLPGLTGLWQIQARQDSSFARYIALDTAYIENWSFWLDLKILIRTAEVVFRGTGT